MQVLVERRFTMLWVISALLVAALRFSCQVPISYDLALQIQAAQNLLDGKGLSIYSDSGPELAAPARLVTLTYFPSGYSLYAAMVIAAGGSVSTAMRLLAAVATVLGWWGWGKLAFPFFRDGLSRAGPWKWMGSIIAVACPLLFTGDWDGTDIFLWAALPWVMLWLVRASTEDSPHTVRFDILAGALCGISLLMRYAGLFLGAYAGLLILIQCRMDFSRFARRCGAFALSFLPCLSLQIYINYFLSKTSATPGSLATNKLGLGLLLARVLRGLSLLGSVNYPWTFWFPGFAIKLLFPPPVGMFRWQIGITIAIYAFLLLAARAYGVRQVAAPQDSRIATFGLFVVFPFFLLVCMVLGNYDYLANARYYGPLVPLGVFVVYSIASLKSDRRRTGFIRMIQPICAIYVTVLVVISVMYFALFFAPGERGSIERYRLFESDTTSWPSMGVAPESSKARRFVIQQLAKKSGTVLLASSKLAWFAWDHAVDRSRIHELTCGEMLKAKTLTGPARLVILTFDEGKPRDLWSNPTELSGLLEVVDVHPGEFAHVNCFEDLPDLKLLQDFPQEGLKVLEAQVPAGMHVALRHEQPLMESASKKQF